MAMGKRSPLLKMFGSIVLIVGLMASCSYFLDSSTNGEAAPESSASISRSTEDEKAMSDCADIVHSQPGDVRFVLRYQWTVKCVMDGEDMGGGGDIVTVAYADFYRRTIFVYAPVATEQTLAHEAAHALDDLIFIEEDRQRAAEKLGARTWVDDATAGTWRTPAEMFAEGRAVCLGYPDEDSEYSLMSCTQIDQMIAATDFADEVAQTVNRAQ